MEQSTKQNHESDMKSNIEESLKSNTEQNVESNTETTIVADGATGGTITDAADGATSNMITDVADGATRKTRSKAKETKGKSSKSVVAILFLILLIILLGLTLVWVTIDENALLFSRTDNVADENNVALPADLPANQMARQIGLAIREYVNDENRDEVIATILGKEVTAMHFNITRKLLALAGSNDPETDAWNAIKIQAYERQFAMDRNLLPTNWEIERFTQEMREMFESTPEGLEFSRILLEAAGMTEDEYWNNFRLIYESPAHLISIKVADYRAENGWNDPTAEAIVRQVNEMMAAENNGT